MSQSMLWSGLTGAVLVLAFCGLVALFGLLAEARERRAARRIAAGVARFEARLRTAYDTAHEDARARTGAVGE
jgi:predicted component of type VI protein secretion system